MKSSFIICLGILLICTLIIPSQVSGSQYTYSFVHLSDVQNLNQYNLPVLNKTFTEIETLKTQYNISAVFVTGDLTNSAGTQFIRYVQSSNLTTVPMYEVSGNHDVGGVAGNYIDWDRYLPNGSQKHDYGFVFNDFVVYGLGYNGDNGVNTAVKPVMVSYFANNPDKVPLILTHVYFDHALWVNGARHPIAYDILNSLTRNSLILTGHCHNSTSNGILQQAPYNNINVIEDMINYQDWSGYSGGRLYNVTTDGLHITCMTVSNLNLNPVFSVNNTVVYPTFTHTADPKPHYTLVVASTASSDGEVYRGIKGKSGEQFPALRNGAGTGSSSNNGYIVVGIRSANNNVPGSYNLLQKGELLFNTSGLPDNAIIVNATLSVWSDSSSKSLTGLGVTAFGITGITPYTTGSVNTRDYQNTASVRYSDGDIPQPDIKNYQYNIWSFNADGISAISKTGWTPVAVRSKWDIDNDQTGLTWLPYQSATQVTFFASEKHAGKEPILTIRYSLP